MTDPVYVPPVQPWDGLPLDTPTKVAEDVWAEHWAIRTANGGTLEARAKAGAPVDQSPALDQLLRDAIAANRTFIALSPPTAAQVAAQVKALSRQVNALIRVARGLVDTVD